MRIENHPSTLNAEVTNKSHAHSIQYYFETHENYK